MRFDWDDLKYFLAVARARKLTAAARRLGTDHTTVSRRIRDLEYALAASLFERSPRGYALTEDGAQLLRHAEEMERIAALASEKVGGAKALLSGRVRIGAPDGFGAYFLAPRVAMLCAQNPDLEIEIVPVPMNFSIPNREADIVIAMGAPKEGRLASRQLTKYRLRLYGAPGYLEQHDPVRTLDDVAKHLLIGHISDLMFSPAQDYLPELSAMKRPQVSTSSSVAQLKATRSGSGLCVLADFMARTEDNLTPVLPERTTIFRELWLITSVDYQDIARIRAVIDFIVDSVRRERALFLPPD
ncbi:MAG: LysR family transcriptional regulator [Rhizobiaceae bacterium]